MRRLSSNPSNKFSENWKTPYIDIIAVGTIQFFLSSLTLCYGVFLMQFVLRDFYDLKTSLWTVITFVAASKITNPWVKSYCKHLDNVKSKVHKRNIIATVILLFIDLVVVAFLDTSTNQIIFYGTFGGILSSIIYVHLKFATAEAFKFQTRTFDVLDQITKPFGLIFMPHLFLFFTNLYGTARAQLILSGLILNIIPACLLIRRKTYRKARLCKFQTVDRLSIEMADLNNKSVNKEPSTSSSDEDEDYDECEEVVEDIASEKSEPSSPEPNTNNVQKYFENFGVKILPNIPEEDETDEDDDINEITSKRLSRISAILLELKVNNVRRPSNLSGTNFFQPDETVETFEPEPENEKYIDDFIPKKSRCFSITSNIIYEWNLKKRQVKSFFYNHFVKSIPRTLKTIQFYPALVSNCITTTLSTIIFATAPCLMFLKNEHITEINYPNTPEEATFLLTIIGFTWLFFLAGYPVFSTLSSLKTKILFLVGLSISGLSLFIAHKFSYDNFTLFSLTFGLGHGIISYTESNAHENFFGQQRWKMIQGALEICTGYVVILVYIIIYYNTVEIYVLLSYAHWIYAFSVVLWIFAYAVKLVVGRVRK